MKRRLILRMTAVLMTAVILAVTIPYKTSYAKTTGEKLNEAQREQERMKGEVAETQKEKEELTEKKGALNKELNNFNSQLDVIVANINDLDERITKKEAEIAATQEALAEAIEVETTQYQSMKKRIQFMYEDSRSLYLEIMFKAKSFSNFITLSNYIDSLADYDKMKLDEYEAIRISVEELEAKLQGEKEELDGLMAEAEAEKASMMDVISDTQSSISKYSDLIEDVEAELLKKEAELEAQRNTVEALQKQLEEELRLTALANASAWRDISEVSFSENDRYLLAVLIYCEAGGEPYEGQLAVGAVVINRILSSVYPNTMTGVIYQDWQFSPVKSGRFEQYLAIGKTTNSCYSAADAAMSGATNVGNALHFRTPLPGLNGIQIGNHVFY